MAAPAFASTVRSSRSGTGGPGVNAVSVSVNTTCRTGPVPNALSSGSGSAVRPNCVMSTTTTKQQHNSASAAINNATNANANAAGATSSPYSSTTAIGSPFSHHHNNSHNTPYTGSDPNLSPPQSSSHLNSAGLSFHHQRSPTSSSSSISSSIHSTLNTSGASATATRPRMTRNNSHLRRAGAGALVIPIPPKLANSPHLQSPNSIFRRPHPGPRASPGVEEERWLRDTVPIGSAADVVVPPPPLPTVPLSASTARELGLVASGSVVEHGRARSNSVVAGSVSPRHVPPPSATTASPAFSLLPSSLPRQGVYAHGHALSPRPRG